MANLLVFVGVIAVGLAAMKDASPWMMRSAFSLMVAVLAIAALGVVVRKGEPGWVGFAMFGWGYAALAFCPAAADIYASRMVTTPVMDWLAEQLFEPPVGPKAPPFDVGGSPWDNAIYKVVNGSLVPLSAAEKKASQAYGLAVNRYIQSAQATNAKVENARQIGYSFLALALGLVGAGLGRFLADFRRRGASPRIETDTAVHTQNPIP
ncbi:MAG TPA: hypothetical protein VGZ22_01625 [Isosphaeraceae bacterium]|nr:hypothetical protein [Isosphaeraceae bacterium]